MGMTDDDDGEVVVVAGLPVHADGCCHGLPDGAVDGVVIISGFE
jgi:hypothetical protein